MTVTLTRTDKPAFYRDDVAIIGTTESFYNLVVATFPTRQAAKDGLNTLADGAPFFVDSFVYRKVIGSRLIKDFADAEPVGRWTLQHFGAVLDGVTDDTDAVQAAMDARGLGSEPVLVPESAAIATRFGFTGQQYIELTGNQATARITRPIVINALANVTFIGGRFRADHDDLGNNNFGTQPRRCMGEVRTLARSMFEFRGNLGENFRTRDFDIQNVHFHSVEFDGNFIASGLYYSGTYNSHLHACTVTHWPDEGYGVLTGSGRIEGDKNGAFDAAHNRISQYHISETSDNSPGRGFGLIIQTADAILTANICYSADCAVGFDEATNIQIMGLHPFNRGGDGTVNPNPPFDSGQKGLWIGSNCTGAVVTGCYFDTGDVLIESFERMTYMGNMHTGGASHLILKASGDDNDQAEGLRCIGNSVINVVFDESEATFRDNVKNAVFQGNSGQNGGFIRGLGGRMDLQRGTGFLRSINFTDRNGVDSHGIWSPAENELAWGNGSNQKFLLTADGPVIKSPNGTRYALTVDNAGNLTTTAV